MQYPAYLSIQGERQGLISAGASSALSVGNQWQEMHEDEIFVYAVTHKMSLRNGQREHKPYVFIKDIDKTSPLLRAAMASGELLPECTLKLYRINQTAGYEHFLTVTLNDAIVSRIDIDLAPRKKLKQPLRERVSLRYRKIQFHHEQGGTHSSDIWDAGVERTADPLYGSSASTSLSYGNPAKFMDMTPDWAKGSPSPEKQPALAPQNTKSQKPPKRTLRIGVFFDGTGQNNENDTYKEINGNKSRTNVARLYEAYPLEPGVSEKIYVSGVGTVDKATHDQIDAGEDEKKPIQAFGLDPTPLGVLGGTGAFYKWQSLLAELQRIIRETSDYNEVTEICFDVFGFSRGAALARHFVNAVSLGLPDYSQHNDHFNPLPDVVPNLLGDPTNEKFSRFDITPDDTQWGASDWHRMASAEKDFYPLDTKRKASVRFLGLFDTVGSFFMPGNDNNAPFQLGIKPGAAKAALQLVAHDEYRQNFPLTSLAPAGETSGPYYEEVLPGCHTDVGGGYPSMQQYNKTALPEQLGYPVESTYRLKWIKKQDLSGERINFAYPGGSSDFDTWLEEQGKKEEVSWDQTCLGSVGYHGRVRAEGSVLHYYELHPVSNALSGVALSRMLQQSEEFGIDWVHERIDYPDDHKGDELIAALWQELEALPQGQITQQNWSHYHSDLWAHIHVPHDASLQPGYRSAAEQVINGPSVEQGQLKRMVFDNV